MGSIPESFEVELDDLAESMLRLQADPTTGGPALGVPEWDARLWRMGREALSVMGVPPSSPSPPLPLSPSRLGRPMRDLYLATHVYADGGHTALIGDFVRALGSERARLVLTDLSGTLPRPLPDDIVSRIALPMDRIRILAGPSKAARLDQLFAELLAFRPDRLFLFHHPWDPLPSVVAQPEIARQRLMIHHADATLSFGIHIPGVTLVDLNPAALAPTSLGGRESVLLRLTAPDPGRRPRGFRARDGITTAASGNMHKFYGNYIFSYAETIARVMRATGGSHLHIGAVSTELRGSIDQALGRYGVTADRFNHVPWSPSLAATLWAHDCDLFLASFPLDGARTKVEVLASGTPYLRHVKHAPAAGTDPRFDTEGLLCWRDWDDLESILDGLKKPGELESRAAVSRDLFERLHHPDVFATRLRGILDGSIGPEAVSANDLSRALMRLLRPALLSPRPAEP